MIKRCLWLKEYDYLAQYTSRDEDAKTNKQ